MVVPVGLAVVAALEEHQHTEASREDMGSSRPCMC